LPRLDVEAVLAARRRRGLVAVFDVDGTLLPIARAPEAVVVPSELRAALAGLAARTDTVLGIVSGRPVADVLRLLGTPHARLVGMHGYERRPPGGPIERRWPPRASSAARSLGRTLRTRIPAHLNLRFEYKGPLLAVHVRGLPPAMRDRVARIVRASCPPDRVVLEGRRVFELRPADAPTKGDGVRWIASALPGAAVLFVGDDVTDEDGFSVLGPRDFPVQVVDPAAVRERAFGTTAARAALGSTDAVRNLVEILASARACPSERVSVAKDRDATSARRRRRRDLPGCSVGPRTR